MGKYKRLPEHYFKFVNPIIVSLIGVGVYLLLMAWLDPKSISTTYFGRVAEFATWLGTENSHLMKQIFLVMCALHISEAMVAVFLCYKRKIGPWATIAWTIQTLLLGIFSLYLLIWPGKPPKPAKKQEKPSSKNSKKSNKKDTKKDQKKTTNNNQKKPTANHQSSNAAQNKKKSKSKKEK